MQTEEDFVATVIKIARNPSRPGPSEYPGWIVPGTEGLLAIDERYPAWQGTEDDPEGSPATWFITHIPTGFHVNGVGCHSGTKLQAAQHAQNFFDEYRNRGWDLNSTDAKAIAAPVNALSADERKAFRAKVFTP